LSRLKREALLFTVLPMEKTKNLQNLAFPLDLNIPECLPIHAKSEAIIDAISKHQVIIIAGETGSGKTTQLAKLCLLAGVRGTIGHTQPRRMAARSVATRIAEETGCNLGKGVGYRVRFSDHSHRDDAIQLMTDGILLNDIHHDRLLQRYKALIIDEAHERSLNIDFLLGYIKNILPKRPDLKLIITSATINTARFSAFYADAPVITVEGRGYPVGIQYYPIADNEDDRERDLPQAIIDAVDEAAKMDPLGDILLFLSGERDIRDISHTLQQHAMRDTEILPLYARLSAAEQDRVFKPHRGRRIILATNIAETSLTVPGIRFVIDVGLARISRYSSRARLQRLPIERISQASANQRAGRCGRVAAGVCFRLYSEDDFERRLAQTQPEIQRTHLGSVILRMAAMELGSLASFPLMDAPEARAIADGHALLFELKAMDESQHITAEGRRMARLPLDPRFARMLLSAEKTRVLDEVMIIVSGLSIPDPRLRPTEEQAMADEKHRIFADQNSDFVSLLKLWQWFHQQQQHATRSKMRRLCKQHYISWLRMREWHDLHQQLHQQWVNTDNHHQKESHEAHASEQDSTAIHRALLSGLLSQTGMKLDDGLYQGVRGLRFAIMPGSNLRKKPPPWLMATELLELRQRYGSTVATIDPTWLPQLAAHLLSHSHGEPYWSKRRGQVLAQESSTLFGLPLGSKPVNWGTINKEQAQGIFIREALVERQLKAKSPIIQRFVQHQKALWQQVEQCIGKSRRLDLNDAKAEAESFYSKLLPQHICDQRALERWGRKHNNDAIPVPTLEQLLPEHNDNGVDFPETLNIGREQICIRYRFDPQHGSDGMTLVLLPEQLPLISTKRLAWLVPGLLYEKMVYLFKKLPSSQRRRIAPVPQFAQACLEAMTFGEGNLYANLSRELRRMANLMVPLEQWLNTPLPSHLCMHMQLIDEAGKPIASGDDLATLQHHHGTKDVHSQPLSRREGIHQWDFGDLPQQCTQQHQGRVLTMYPALTDAGDSVRLELCDREDEAKAATRSGLSRLFALQLKQQVQWVKKKLPQRQALTMHHALLHSDQAVTDQLINACIQHLFMAEPWPCNADSFQQRLQQYRAAFVPTAETTAKHLLNALQVYNQLKQQLETARAAEKQTIATQIKAQLEKIISPTCIETTPFTHLQHLPRYLQAASHRLEHGPRRFIKDQQAQKSCETLWDAYQAYLKQYPEATQNPNIEAFRWSLEELRVSLFAPHLKTAETVSIKRLQQRWQAVICEL